MSQVVLVGAGDWVMKQYAPALSQYCMNRAGVADVSAYVLYDPTYASKKLKGKAARENYNAATMRNLRTLKRLGLQPVDWSDQAARNRIFGTVVPLAVFVVSPDDTHCQVVHEWLGRAHNIIVEKPFATDKEEVRRLRAAVKKNATSGKLPTKVYGFDHYLVRANQFKLAAEGSAFISQGKPKTLAQQLGKIRSFEFRMLEPTDAGMPERAASLQRGLILDMASHMLPLIQPFGDPQTVAVDNVRAGMYGKPPKKNRPPGSKIMEKGRETFADLDFRFSVHSKFGEVKIEANAAIGKCIGNRSEKRLRVMGDRGGVEIDLANNVVDFIDRHGQSREPVASLYPDPIFLLVREILAERGPKFLRLLTLDDAQAIVDRLDALKQPVDEYLKRRKKQRRKAAVPEYRYGASLDEVRMELDYL